LARTQKSTARLKNVAKEIFIAFGGPQRLAGLSPGVAS
jgi:hypothetical protein